MKRVILIPIFLVLIVGLAIFWIGTTWLKAQTDVGDLTTDHTPLQIVIGNDVLEIPTNFTRLAKQREGETADRLDLVMLWPDGNGYSEDRAALFKTDTGRASRILVTLLRREMDQDMTARLNTVYRELFDGQARKVGSGIRLQSLLEGSGYDGEVLAISDNGRWVARCETGPEVDEATCLRDVHLGQSLSVRYRFSRKLLRNWKSIEALVTGRIEGFLIR